ncbi:hemerythrin domain-containing protein [Actinoplanes sp. NPDC049802]|uniref:hemerythrin domain-containing protein n=1 Tax=Actinoplanes sp. NPDC049802 TaxID=3154742 RepID=UPI0033D86AF0
MASDAVTLIKNDHRLMKELFAQLKHGDENRRALVAEIEARLSAHARAEETEVYPIIAKATGEKADLEHGTYEHLEAEHKLRKVRNLIDSPHFDQALEEFVAAVEHHMEEEESELLPALEKATDKKTLDRLGATFERARIDELSTSGYEQPPGTARHDTDDLANATRDELYEKAQKASIPGRSHMRKEDLIEALRDQT